MKPGTGWVLEKYDGSECSTLVSYLAHVKLCQHIINYTSFIFFSPFCISLTLHLLLPPYLLNFLHNSPFQLDLKNLPPLIVNRVLRRQPLAIHYINRKLSSPSKQFTSSYPSSVDSPFHTSVSSEYEDTFPVHYYMNRTDSYRKMHKQRSATSSTTTGATEASSDNGKPKSATISGSIEVKVETESGKYPVYSREAGDHQLLLNVPIKEDGIRSRSPSFTFSLPQM